MVDQLGAGLVELFRHDDVLSSQGTVLVKARLAGYEAHDASAHAAVADALAVHQDLGDAAHGHQVGRAGHAADDATCYDSHVALVDEAGAQCDADGVLQHLVDGVHALAHEGVDAPEHGELAIDEMVWGHGDDRHVGPEAGQLLRSRAASGGGDDGGCADVLGCVHCCLADRIGD